MKKQLLIAGGSGLIGAAISEAALSEGWEITLLSRAEGRGRIKWDPGKDLIDMQEVRAFDAIINLAGTSIAGARWTDERKKDIVESRVNACRTLEKYLQQGKLKTSVYIGASAIGIYGDRKDEQVDESTRITADDNWMVKTVQDWEAGHHRIAALGIRTVICRIGIVLSRNGGALPEMLRTAPLGILGYFGNGRQIWPWIHVDDLVSIFLRAAGDDKMHGIYFAGSPNPVSNKEMTVAASKAYSLHRIVVPVPVFMLTILLGKMQQMLLQSCNGRPMRLLQEGFRFRYNTIEETMQNLIGKQTEEVKIQE